MHRFVVPALVMAALTAAAPTLTPQRSGTTNRLQAVSPVSARVVWASGVGGTFTVTTDGGATWRAGVVPGFLFQMHVSHLRGEWALWITSGAFELLGLAGLSFILRRDRRWRLVATIAAFVIASLLAVATLATIRA